MDLSALNIEPTEGKIAVTLLEGDDGEPEPYPGEPGQTEELLLGIIAGVGPKVTGLKKGDTVAVYAYVRNSPCLGGHTHITDSYCILAKIKPD